ncbi:MAG: glutamine-hydrolyzing carbamoyl-phosphate synthase small subunit, partial [Deltaproteobacteria bacterium]|nr:glutamine-hydrolyzing carbamoyl-phosphate synthase small subunit [Deltaproteobacteria bacterium]
MNLKPAHLILSDGKIFSGTSFGDEGARWGEVVFNTSLTGYQEILTDPSYQGQIVVMTYPEVGNTGANPVDVESAKIYLSGFVVKENSPIVSNFRAKSSLSAFLKKNKVPAVEGIDTRALVRHIRDAGAKPALIHVGVVTDFSKLKKKAAALPSMEGQDLAKVVSCKKPYGWNRGSHRIVRMVGAQGHEVVPPRGRAPVQKKKFNVIAYDFGIKQNILRMLVDAGCRVKVVPADYPAEEVLGQNPDGVFLSNGPGDPAVCTYAVENVRKILGKKPMFGICLGHQIMGLALGGKTFKLKFGHHGGNQPVMDLSTQKVEITAQHPEPARVAPASAAQQLQPAPPAVQVEAAQTIRVEISKLDSVMNLLGELATAKIRFDQRIQEISGLHDEVNRLNASLRRGVDLKSFASELGLVDTAFKDNLEEQRRASDEVRRISGELQEAVMRTRMIPVGTVLKKFPRMVRDIARDTNKKVKLTILGEDTEMDKTVVESIGDPLMHLIRNAIDHGVEPPAARLQAGKPEEGQVVIRAGHQGDMVVISIGDDGAGLRRDKILNKAIERGLVAAEAAPGLSSAAVCDLIFRPGFSTAEKVTDLSGRGVGMDVVRSQISKLKGTVDVQSVEGKGSTFTIKLPLTLAIIQVLMVTVGQRRYALPLTAVQETLSVPNSDIHAIGLKQVFNLRGEAVSLVRLADMLGLKSMAWTTGEESKVVVVNVGQDKVGLQVDVLMDMREVVIKTLGTVLKHVKFATGTTIMGDGSLVLILDLPELARETKNLETTGMAGRKAEEPIVSDAKPAAQTSPAAPDYRATLLLVDDSPTVIRLVAPAVQRHGFRVLTASDGVEALEVLGREKVDAVATDVSMPRLDGYGVCREIRKRPAFQSMPVILFSSKGDKLDKVRGFDVGADEYIEKPLDPAVLVAKLEQLLRRT